MYEVVLSVDARRFYDAADSSLTRRLNRCFESLETDPRRGNNIKRLSGELAAYFRFRVGDHRVIYRIDDRMRTVVVVAIAHRKNVYE